MRAARKVMSVVGARPNFMKTAPVVAALARRSDPVEHVLVHTGQHYDDAMSTIFFEELGVGRPDHMLEVGSGSHALQTARVVERIEPVMIAEAPDLVLVPGDVNSTLAAALVAAKLQIPVGHIEAGLRSFDRKMPEETNRIVADAVSNLLFTHSREARDNLRREGCHEDRIHAVGNTMIDTLVALRKRIDALDAPACHGLQPGSYLVVTMHRPALVDGPLLAETLRALEAISEAVPVVFPIHPRTAGAMERIGFHFTAPHIRLLDPLGYLEFLSLVASARGVLTDSGGIQEETTYLRVPCFTLRDNTERPVTCELGTNVLLGLDPRRIEDIPGLLDDGSNTPPEPPPGWDGVASERLVDVIEAGVPDWDDLLADGLRT